MIKRLRKVSFLAAAPALAAAASLLFFLPAVLAQTPNDNHPDKKTSADAERYPHKIDLIDGKTIYAEVTRIKQDGAIEGENVPPGLRLDDLRRLQRQGVGASVRSPGLGEGNAGDQASILLELAGGGRLWSTSVAIEDEQAHIQWLHGDALKLPIDALRGIRYQPEAKEASFENALATPNADFDHIFVKTGGPQGRLQPVKGLITQLTSDRINFEWDGETRTAPRSRVYGVVLAQVAGENRPPQSLTILQDGSSLPGKIGLLEKRILTLRLGPSAQAAIPFGLVSRIDVRSGRMQFLSDLEPDVAEQTPIVTLRRPWRKDRSVGGRSLSLGEKQYEKGLGVHAASRLTYELKEPFHVFAAVVGIDDETQGRGDCVVKVLGDERELYTARLQGGKPANPLRLDIRGVRRLTLIVEPGEDLDLADHVDWCDARVIRSSPVR